MADDHCRRCRPHGGAQMTNRQSSGREPSIEEIAFECISELSRVGGNPILQKAIKPLVRVLVALRHIQFGEHDEPMCARAPAALDELSKLVEAKPAEAPKSSKPKLRIFSGAAERVR